MTTPGAQRIERAIRDGARGGREAALVAFVTAGFPSREAFGDVLRAAGSAADVVEIGVPFTDPMADGVTIQRSSRVALEQGTNLAWILEAAAGLEPKPAAPLVLMSYLNPLLSFGFEQLAERAAEAGVSGVIVPDLPLEESRPLAEATAARGLALVSLVTPVTPPARRRTLAEASRGFLYAVTSTGTTGGRALGVDPAMTDYLAGLREMSPVPVCAGFGVRSAEHVAALAPHVDGIIVGSALVEAIERGDDPAEYLRELRAGAHAKEETP
jgi:tryptophan synthase alpha chain